MSNPSADEVLKDPSASQTPQRPWDGKGSRWVVPVVIVSLVVGLAGLGVGAYAVATTPAKTSGPQGPVGKTGATGPQGQQGLPGPRGQPALPAPSLPLRSSPAPPSNLLPTRGSAPSSWPIPPVLPERSS